MRSKIFILPSIILKKEKKKKENSVSNVHFDQVILVLLFYMFWMLPVTSCEPDPLSKQSITVFPGERSQSSLFRS